MNDLQLYMLKFPNSFSREEFKHYFPDCLIFIDDERVQELELELEHKTDQYMEASLKAVEFSKIINKFIEQEEEIKKFRENLLKCLNEFKIKELDIQYSLNDMLDYGY